MKALLTALTALTLLPAHADTASAEALVREGKPAEALAALDEADLSPTSQFWRGRALVDMGRLEEASYSLEAVPPGHELYPYAARALIYCAWQSPELDFPSLVAPLTESSDIELSRIATAALAEYELRRDKAATTGAFQEFEELAAYDKRWELARRLMLVEHLRQQQRFDEALVLCRALESDRTLPALAHQRVRLALSEVYYAMEAAQPAPQPAPSTGFAFPGTEEELPESDEGKGEETLLQFIASQPDSPLLEEAFRRLAAHGAFEKSEYARSKLAEWMDETNTPRRAALALRVRQHLLHREQPKGQLDASCANTAASLLPRELMTAQILREQARMLLAQGKGEEARLYLHQLGTEDARSLFYEGMLLAAEGEDALPNFLRSATLSSEDMRAAALSNALLTALAAGEDDVVERIMSSPQPPAVRRSLLSIRSAFYMPRDAQRARRDLVEWMELSPSATPPPDAVMDLAILDMAENAQASLESLRELFACPRRVVDEEQEMRLCSLLMEAARRAAPQGSGAQAALDMAHSLAGKATHPAVRTRVTLKLASMLSGLRRHREALDVLQGFLAAHPGSSEAPRALLMAGHEARHIGSLDSLRLALQLYARCGATRSPYARRARLHQAAILARINRRPEARAMMQAELSGSDPLTADDKALAHCALADAWALEGTDAGLDEATAIISRLLDSGEVSDVWLFRIRMQRAILYSRRGLHQSALADYLAELERMPALSAVPTESDWFSLYFAGGGAVYQYIRLHRYAEAAALAERIAKWGTVDAEHSGVPARGPLADRFAAWAAAIRQEHPVD